MKYLHRHPVELDLSVNHLADVAWIAREIEKLEAEKASRGIF